jgi:protoporphyrinogen oxidase
MKTAIIMGAGPAGLTAAYELLTRTDIKPVIIERDNQVGGLSKTINYKGNLIDIGGHRFFSKSEEIVEWWLNFLPLKKNGLSEESVITYRNQSAAVPHASKNENVFYGNMLLRPRKSSIFYDKSFFDYPLQLNLRTIRNFGLARISLIGASYIKSKLFPSKNESNLAEFFTNRFGRELYETFFKGYTEKIWGVPCESIPANWGRQRIKDLNIGKVIMQSFTSLLFSNKSITQQGVSTSLIEQFLYPERGPGQMWEAVAQQVTALGGEIHLDTAIDKIRAGEDGQYIHSVNCKRLSSGETFILEGDYFFSTIPVKHLVANLENTAVPELVLQTAGSLRYRDFIIVGLLLQKTKEGKEGNISTITDNWIYLQDKQLQAARLQIFNNWSPYMVKDKDTLWIGVEYFCNDTDPLWKMDKESIIALAVNEMAGTGLLWKEQLLDATVIRVPKAYPSYTGAYESFDVLKSYLDIFENLYLIGRNGMHRYNNTDHSMMTAMTAVDNIVQQHRSHENIWSVNMEQDYHEQK